jgi:hypothetical protein
MVPGLYLQAQDQAAEKANPKAGPILPDGLDPTAKEQSGCELSTNTKGSPIHRDQEKSEQGH